jgi:hypothetical protein
MHCGGPKGHDLLIGKANLPWCFGAPPTSLRNGDIFAIQIKKILERLTSL